MMEMMTWSIQTSPQGVVPILISDYLLNDLGIFIKNEKRMPKKDPLTAVTGFRVGYVAIPGTDYRAVPINRNAILWYKVTSVAEDGDECLTIHGNRNDVIRLCFAPENRDAIVQYILTMRHQHPAIATADHAAASWICWRDDDEWDDPFLPLADMVQNEMANERFIEQEVLEETELTVAPDYSAPTAPASYTPPSASISPTASAASVPLVASVSPTASAASAPPNASAPPAAFVSQSNPVEPVSPATAMVRPKFCKHCGATLLPIGDFCGKCGARIKS